MIAVRVSGGLGNQLFQYAAGYSLSRNHHTDLAVETSFYQHNTSRQLMLGAFNADPPTTSYRKLYHVFHIPGTWYADRLFNKNKVLAAPYLYREKHFHYDAGLMKCADNTLLDGYWQSEKYFKEYEADIRQLYQLKRSEEYNHHPLAECLRQKDAVAVHIRAGDYIADASFNKIHGSCSAEYYHRARHMILQQNPDAAFYIFSDQADAVAGKWPNANYTMISTQADDPLLEFHLMQLPRNMIIANSTFSWWAAWLNADPHKKIIAPQNWFRDKSKDTADLFPAGWNLING